MSTLTTTLICLVVAVLAGVGLFNLVQNRRASAARREAAADETRGEAATAASAAGAGLPRRSEPNLGLDLDLPLHSVDSAPLEELDPDSVPDEMARISQLEKAVPQSVETTSRAGAAEPALSASAGAGFGAGTASAYAGGTRTPDRSPADTAHDVTARSAHDVMALRPDGDATLGSRQTETGIIAGQGRGNGPAGDAMAESAPPAGAPLPPVPGILNVLCDCIVEIKLGSPYGAERLLGLSQSLRRVGSKPVVFEGWQADRRAGSGYWVPISAGQAAASFGVVRAGVLLANRHGPLNAMEFSEFTNGLSVLADQLGGKLTLPDMTPVLEKARALDDACIELDAQVGLNVDASEPLSPSDIDRLAREQRLVERGNNRYARLGPHGEVVFSVSQVEHPNRVTFLLDVPRVAPSFSPWDQLVQCATASAARLQGLVVDDEGRPLLDPTLAQIGEQLLQRCEALELAGFPAGSPVALRLFN